ncbi:hypothetical protein PSQ90_06255 [Devosia rhodophyticola]|uniref:Uncharacterized protein n=1 Tax=Devosia rhodophyticola TaxID=3026423 RepID=A0ABY7Z0N1_9HYPH|nr:hypothetical protein [Devosia rhodophyticola]WDR07037.1 hypothetical protein PSQ90_06255 [Devosia rhodophyticola]
MILQLLAMWAVVALAILWFVKDERARRARREAEQDAIARQFARPSATRLAVARLGPMTERARVPVLSTDDRELANQKH